MKNVKMAVYCIGAYLLDQTNKRVGWIIAFGISYFLLRFLAGVLFNI